MDPNNQNERHYKFNPKLAKYYQDRRLRQSDKWGERFKCKDPRIWPYGKRVDWDPMCWGEWPLPGSDIKTGLKQLPFQGPPNWDDIWFDVEHQGEDHKEVIPQGQPMSDKHMAWLARETSSDIPDDERVSKISDIEFVHEEGNGGEDQFEALGAGSGGCVWHVRAKDEQGREVHLACKVDSPNAPTNWEEMYSLRFVDHPNIVSVRDVITIPDQKTGFPFSRVLIFMDLCGGSLAQLREKTAQKRMSEQSCKHWFRQIAGALNYLHSEFEKGGLDMVHGDVKLENILHYEFLWDNQAVVDEQTVVALTFKLADFSLAQCFSGSPNMFARQQKRREEQRNYYQVAKSLGLSRKLLNLMWRMRYKFETVAEVVSHPWLRQ